MHEADLMSVSDAMSTKFQYGTASMSAGAFSHQLQKHQVVTYETVKHIHMARVETCDPKWAMYVNKIWLASG